MVVDIRAGLLSSQRRCGGGRDSLPRRLGATPEVSPGIPGSRIEVVRQWVRQRCWQTTGFCYNHARGQTSD
ncbi:MAG: hypothetical protein N3E40_06420 [Dehalococcoidia bacterium]|nr:hypothetical protein [Dehalococcoidia bacterium]